MTACYVYRIYSRDGTLLYVGMSEDPAKRMIQHRGEKAWPEEVAGFASEEFSDRAAASEEERRAIAVEKPKYNVLHGGSAERMVRKPGQAVLHLRFTEVALAGIDALATKEQRTRSDMIRVLIRRGWEEE